MFALLAFVCVIKDSVPVAEVVGVEEGRVEILPQKSVEDTDKDFTGGLSREAHIADSKSVLISNHTAWWTACLLGLTLKLDELVNNLHGGVRNTSLTVKQKQPVDAMVLFIAFLQFSMWSAAAVGDPMGYFGDWAGPSSAAPVGSSETSGRNTWGPPWEPTVKKKKKQPYF